MSNKELILVIWSLIGSLSETNHPQFKGIASKKRGELLWFERKTDSNKFKYKDA